MSNASLRKLSLILVVLALLVTGYLTYAKFTNQEVACANVGVINCSLVENSAYSMLLGVPVSLWGFLMHLMIGAILLLEPRIPFFRNWGPTLLVIITLSGIVFHSYLTYISLSVLQAVCMWCLIAFAIMIIQFFIALRRVWKPTYVEEDNELATE